jgi:hypothetical protein
MSSKLMLNTIAVALCFAAAAAAQAPRIYLDFNHDDDLWTIDPFAGGSSGEISVILEVGEDTDLAGEGLEIGFLFDCWYDNGDPPGNNCITFPCEQDWCNPLVLDQCQAWLCCPCECYIPYVNGELRDIPDLAAGQRYLLGTITAHSAGGDCSTQIVLDVRIKDYIIFSNPGWLEPGELPTDPISWGKIKWIYHDIPTKAAAGERSN